MARKGSLTATGTDTAAVLVRPLRAVVRVAHLAPIVRNHAAQQPAELSNVITQRGFQMFKVEAVADGFIVHLREHTP